MGLHFHSKGGAALTLAGGGVIGAGFALTRDAGRRPPPGELAGAPCGIGVGRRVVGAGFALPRDAGRRPALQRCRSESSGRTRDPRLSSRARGNGVNRRGEERSSAGDVGPVLDHLLPPAAVGGKQSLCRLPVRLQQVYETGVEILL